MRVQPTTPRRTRIILVLFVAMALGFVIAPAQPIGDVRVTAVALMMLTAFLSGVQGLGTD